MAADDRRRFVNERVVAERLDHEEGEVDPASQVAGEDRVADVAAPHRQALARALLQVAATHHRPAGRAGKNSPAGFDMVVELGEAQPSANAPEHAHDQLELERVHVLAVEADVPAATEHQARPRLGEVEHGLGGTARVLLHAHGDEHGQHALAAGDGLGDHLAIVGVAGEELDPPTEAVELADAGLAADADDLVAAIERVLDHVLAELARGADDADSLLRGTR